MPFDALVSYLTGEGKSEGFVQKIVLALLDLAVTDPSEQVGDHNRECCFSSPTHHQSLWE